MVDGMRLSAGETSQDIEAMSRDFQATFAEMLITGEKVFKELARQFQEDFERILAMDEPEADG